MASDAISPIIEQLKKIPFETKEIDFIIVSNGGDPITSIRIMSLLRERFETINVLLPYSAFSAATILALGANKIIMHPYSNLGPVDPQLTIPHTNPNGYSETLQFSSEDVSNYINFIKEDVGITDQQHLVTAVQPLLKDMGAFAIGYAKKGQQLSLRLSEKMLNWHLDNHEQVKTIARSLNSSFYHHGYPVSRTEAKQAIWNTYVQNFQLQERHALHQKNLVASIESANLAKSVYNIIDILYWRDIDQALKYSIDVSDTGWIDYMEV